MAVESIGANATRWGAGLDGKKVDWTGEFIHVPCPLPTSCREDTTNATPIQEFFRDAQVLVTGATGFMGKILVEKLLASCPSIGKIHLIIREKKGKGAEERKQELLNENAFCRVKQTVNNYHDKVRAIHGDCSKPDLGISPDEYIQLAEKVNIIFHGAATVKFTEQLSDATLINVAGTREVLKFARQCQKLKSIVHVSTAYTNTLEETEMVLEKFYPPGKSYKEILELAENNPEKLNAKADDTISPWPNTYAFTKKLAEDLIMKEGVGLPISVFRPGIVIASYKEPTPGWSDNIYGPTAVIVGSYVGAVRVFPCDSDAYANVVPVDLAVNGIIATAWKMGNKPSTCSEDIPIYNYVSVARNPMTWGEFSHWNTVYGWNWPTVMSIWCPMFIYVSNPILLAICFFFLQTIPAVIFDAALWICRKKPQMVATNEKIKKFFSLLSYFGTHNWAFKDENVLNLWKQLSPEDQSIYPFDMAEMDWDQHAQTQVLGLRVHVIKDPISTIDQARKKLKRQEIYHHLVQLFCFAGICWIFYKIMYIFLF